MCSVLKPRQQECKSVDLTAFIAQTAPPCYPYYISTQRAFLEGYIVGAALRSPDESDEEQCSTPRLPETGTL